MSSVGEKQHRAVKTRHKMGYESLIADSVQQCTGSLPLHGKNTKYRITISWYYVFISVYSLIIFSYDCPFKFWFFCLGELWVMYVYPCVFAWVIFLISVHFCSFCKNIFFIYRYLGAYSLSVWGKRWFIMTSRGGGFPVLGARWRLGLFKILINSCKSHQKYTRAAGA